jgi:hypothetical protein
VALDDAIEAGVPPTWTEGVALIRAITAQLDHPSPPWLVPTVAQIFVLPTGHVQMAAARPDPKGPVAGIGHLMGQILDQTSSPAQLLDIQKQALDAASPYASPHDLHEALGFFARPDAQGELAGYFNRAASVLETVVREQALEDLKAKAQAEEPRPKDPSAPRSTRRRVTIIAVLGAAVLASVLVWWKSGMLTPWLSGSARGAAATAVNSVGAVATRAATAAKTAVSQLLGTRPPTSDPPPAPATKDASGRGTSKRRPAGDGAASNLPAPSAGPSSGPSSAANRSVTLPTVPAPMSTGAAEPVLVVQPRIYSSADGEVHPPVLVYPQLPSKRAEGLPNEEPGNLELLVLEDGTVGEAKLIPTSNRIQDRLLISASKA